MTIDPIIAAEKIRNISWPDDIFPVDPVTIAKKLGMQVVETDLPSNVSGALVKVVGKDPIIVVHCADSNNRKRFTCAHELGHYVARAESDTLDRAYRYIDFRDQESSNGKKQEEIFANKFAANLLMPENQVKRILKTNKSHLEAATYFGVSSEAFKHRLNNLGLL